MTIEVLRERLRQLSILSTTFGRPTTGPNIEMIHEEMDDLLLEFINDDKVKEAYEGADIYYGIS